MVVRLITERIKKIEELMSTEFNTKKRNMLVSLLELNRHLLKVLTKKPKR